MQVEPLHRVLSDLLGYQNWWNATSPPPAKDQGINAAGVALRKGDRLMFVRHAERGSWEFPGGMIEPDETPQQAAQREAIEEAGAPEGLDLTQIAEIDSNGVHYTLFVAAVPDEYHPHLADGELDDWLWTSPESPPEPLHPGLPDAMNCLLPATEDDEPDTLGMDANMAFDRGVRSYDQNGHLHVANSNISKANICEYYGKEIPDCEGLGLDPDRRYRLYRDPDELAKAVNSFNRLPVFIEHQPTSADSFPEDLIVGTTGSDAAFEHPYLRNSLSIWRRDAIDGIEREDRKQLSAAYRYRADMTPGAIDNQHFDGVMRDIAGNHVALVPEGRAGADVVVGDSKPPPPEETDMPAARTGQLSRQALFISAACSAFLLPKLAKDQKLPDARQLLQGITAKNWKERRPTFLAAYAKAAKPRIAQDDSIDALAALLNRLEVDSAGGAPEEVEDQLEPLNDKGGEPGAPAPGEEAKDHGGLPEQIAAKLEQWLTPEQMAELRAMAGGTTEPPAEGGGDPPPPDGNDAETDPDDETRRREEEEMQRNKQPPAMDAAAVQKMIDTAVANDRTAERSRFNAIREAERVVRPWIGEIAVAQDSADAVYKLALDSLGVDVKDVHSSAYKPILLMQPKPGEKQQASAFVAMDEAQSKEFAERYPGALSLKRV